MDDDESPRPLADRLAKRRTGSAAEPAKKQRDAAKDAKVAEAPRTAFGEIKAHFTGRPETLNALVLALPLLVFYEVGGLFIDLQNGVDLLSMGLAATRAVSPLLYWGIKLSLIVFFAGLVWYLRREGSFRPAALLPTLVESTVYAVACGLIGSWVVRKLHLADAGRPNEMQQIGFFTGLVMSVGAGFWEEIVFRGGLMNGLAWIGKKSSLKPWVAFVAALVVSSLVFSAIHYIGPMGDGFMLASFVYRFVLGVLFGLIFRFRGFAVAAYTHALYDVLVTVLRAALG